MSFLIVLVAATAAVYVLKPLIKKAPWAWYLVAAALVGVYLAGLFGFVPRKVGGVVFFLMQKGTLATALFAIVMFIGVLPKDSKPRRRLAPIRAELSILACILVLGHAIAYGFLFLPRLFTPGSIVPLALVGLLVALVVSVLALLLGVTSFTAVKSRMSASAWTKLQKLSYVFFGLTYVHVVAMLLPSASAGAAALQNFAAYTLVFGAYAVLRIARAVLDRRALAAADADPAE